MRPAVLLLAVFAAGCAFTAPVPPGEGTKAPAAKQRLESAEQAAYFELVKHYADYAAAHPDDIESNRAAIYLATRAVRRSGNEQRVDVSNVLAWTEPARKTLDASSVGCEANLDIANLLFAAEHRSDGVALLLDSVDRCASATALKRAAWYLDKDQRCGEVISRAQAIWRFQSGDAQIEVLDAVKRCSTSVNLRPNLLSFASEQVVEDYLVLLAARAEASRQRDCNASCNMAYDACQSDCWGTCSWCSERYNLCRASCR